MSYPDHPPHENDGDNDGRWDADERLWQFRPIRSEVDADRFVGVTPFLPEGIHVEKQGERFVIHGEYGFDLFPKHRFVMRIDGELRTFAHIEDIPATIDNVVEFYPDDTHDITLTYTFEKDGEAFTYSHWIHHDMGPWEPVLKELLTRENNGGWNARRDALRRRRHHPLHPDDPNGMQPQRLRQRDPRLETG